MLYIFDTFSSSVNILQVKRVVKHPRYSQSNYDNDIAIVQLDSPVKLEGILNPVCMPTAGKPFTGEDVSYSFNTCNMLTRVTSLFSEISCYHVWCLLVIIEPTQSLHTFLVSGSCHWMGNFERRVINSKPTWNHLLTSVVLNFSGDVSNTLQEVTVPILSNKECRDTGYSSSRITDNMLCAGFVEGMKDR